MTYRIDKELKTIEKKEVDDFTNCLLMGALQMGVTINLEDFAVHTLTNLIEFYSVEMQKATKQKSSDKETKSLR